jgi:hypothetical protein
LWYSGAEIAPLNLLWYALSKARSSTSSVFLSKSSLSKSKVLASLEIVKTRELTLLLVSPLPAGLGLQCYSSDALG